MWKKERLALHLFRFLFLDQVLTANRLRGLLSQTSKDVVKTLPGLKGKG